MNKPPNHLKAAGRRTWEALTAELEFDAAELVLLTRLCEQIDVQTAARRQIAAEGLTVTNAKSGAQKPHPAIAVSVQATRLQAALIRQLAIPADDVKPYAGRTPGGRKHRAPRRTNGTP